VHTDTQIKYVSDIYLEYILDQIDHINIIWMGRNIILSKKWRKYIKYIDNLYMW